MQLKLNKEFFVRHLFVAILMAALGCWFAYDGFFGYPAKTPEALYEEIEKSAPPSAEVAQKVAANAIRRQKEFMVLAFLASFAIGAHLAAVARLRFSFSGDSFTFAGKNYTLADIKKIDDSAWAKKGISRLTLSDGARVTLDAWHHTGVKDFHAIIAPEKNGAA